MLFEQNTSSVVLKDLADWLAQDGGVKLGPLEIGSGNIDCAFFELHSFWRCLGNGRPAAAKGLQTAVLS